MIKTQMEQIHENTQENNGQNIIESNENLVQNTPTDSAPKEIPPYTSPTLLLLEIAPNPMPICVQCPKAMWHIATKSEQTMIRCFCQTMHSITYEAAHNKNPKSEIIIENCDGQLMAIQEMQDDNA